MKKFLSVLLSVILSVICVSFVCCNKPTEQLNLYAPDGAPSLAVANIFSDKKIGNYDVSCNVVSGTDIRAKVLGGDADVAVLPTNMAVSLYNGGCNYIMVSVNVWGVLYLVSTVNITSLNDLIGKVVYSIGLANTPEYVFKTILSYNGVDFVEHGTTEVTDKVMIDYSLTDGSQIVAKLVSGQINYAILGEPAVTNAINKCEQKGITLYNAIDLQYYWEQMFVAMHPEYKTVSARIGYPQACVIVKRSLANDSQFVTALVERLQSNSSYVTENASSLSEVLGTATNYTQGIVQKCNIHTELAKDVVTKVETYLDAINTVMGTNVAYPDNNFYYGK